MNKQLLALAFISELYLFLASIGLAYDNLKVFSEGKDKDLLSFTIFSFSLIVLRCTAFIVILWLIIIAFSDFRISLFVNIIWGVYVYRFVRSIRKKKDFGVIDSTISVICFIFLLVIL